MAGPLTISNINQSYKALVFQNTGTPLGLYRVVHSGPAGVQIQFKLVCDGKSDKTIKLDPGKGIDLVAEEIYVKIVSGTTEAEITIQEMLSS